MDRLDAMQVLLAVVDAGSISAGSRKLNAPLPSVSRKVAELERHLGTKLLIRTSRNVQLTDAGRDYVEAARRIVDQLDEAERRASGEYKAPRGELRVTAPVEFGNRYVLPVALGFLEAHPEISLNLMSVDRIVHLTEEHVDVAIRLGELTDSALYAVRIGELCRLTCASPDYLERRGRPEHPHDLAVHDRIMFGVADTVWWDFSTEGESIVAEANSRIRVTTTQAAIQAAVAGLGLVRLFDYQVIEALRSGALVQVLGKFNGEPMPVHIVYVRQGLLPLKVRAFIDWCLPQLRTSVKALCEI